MQSVQRAVEILRIVASYGPGGARLTDVTGRAALGKSTTFRLLAALVQGGLLEQDPDSKLYFLGLEMLALGGIAANRYGLADMAMPSMERLAAHTEDTVFLSVRQGRESVCIARVIGPYPIKTLTLDVGDRRPLGVGAGSLALLAALPPDEVEAVVSESAAEYRRFTGIDSAAVLRMVKRTRELGYALNDERVVVGMSGVGVPLLSTTREPLAALSVAAISSRMSSARIESLVAALHEEMSTLSDRLKAATGNLTTASFRRVIRR